MPSSLSIYFLLTFFKHESPCEEFLIGAVASPRTSTAELVLGVGRELQQKKEKYN